MLGDVAVAVNPDDERYRDLVGKHVRAADRESRDPGHRRRVRRSGVRHRRGEDHAGARRERLRGGHAPLARDAGRDRRARRRARGGRTPTVACPRSSTASIGSRRASGSSRCSRRAGALVEGRDAPARRAALLPLRHGGRAAPVRSVVREDGAARASPRCRPCATARFAFCPSAGKRCT